MHDRVACTRVLYHHCIHINVRSIGRMTKGIEMSFFKIYRPDVGGHESLGWPVVWSQWRRHQSVCNSVINSVRHSVNNVLQLTIFLAVTLMTLCIGICINVQPKTFGNHRCWRRLPDHVLCLWWTCDMYLAPKLAVWRKLYHGDCHYVGHQWAWVCGQLGCVGCLWWYRTKSAASNFPSGLFE